MKFLAFYESEAIQHGGFPHAVGALQGAGVEVVGLRADQAMGPRVTRNLLSADESADIAGWTGNFLALRSGHPEMPPLEPFALGLDEAANHWTATAGWYLDSAQCDALLVWGCARLRTRAAIHAANQRGLRVVCIEEGPLRAQGPDNGGRTLMIEEGCSYYARPEWPEWREHRTDEARLAGYRAWFMEERPTKGRVWGVGDWPMPSEYAGEPVGLGQLLGDASTYWSGGDEEQMVRDLAAVNGWWKPHPKSKCAETPAGLRPITWQTSIHSVFAARPECVAALCSGAIWEAWLYDLRTVVYGRPGWADPTLTGLEGFGVHAAPDYRERFLDWLLFADSSPLVRATDYDGIARRALG